MKGLVEPIKNKKDVEKLENYLALHNQRNRLIFAIGCNTGLRISDILSLNVEDVKGKNYIELREKKTGKYKRIVLNKKLKGLIEEYLENIRNKTYAIGNDEPLFVGKKHKRLDRSQVYRFLNDASKTVGITENIGCHSLRKVHGFFHYRQFNDIAMLQKIFNHSSPSITLRYIGIDQEQIDWSYANFQI